MAAENETDVGISVNSVLTLKKEGDFLKVKEHLKLLEEETNK